ncbi:hypothetical protein L9F63_021296, partial [Diploptera punctata]
SKETSSLPHCVMNVHVCRNNFLISLILFTSDFSGHLNTCTGGSVVRCLFVKK